MLPRTGDTPIKLSYTGLHSFFLLLPISIYAFAQVHKVTKESMPNQFWRNPMWGFRFVYFCTDTTWGDKLDFHYNPAVFKTRIRKIRNTLPLLSGNTCSMCVFETGEAEEEKGNHHCYTNIYCCGLGMTCPLTSCLLKTWSQCSLVQRQGSLGSNHTMRTLISPMNSSFYSL